MARKVSDTRTAGVGPESEIALARLAMELGAERAGGVLSRRERDLIAAARRTAPCAESVLGRAHAAILGGEDPLGVEFCALRSARQRRQTGAFFTPPEVVVPMLRWALAASPRRLVDPGCGSGRFAAAAVRMQPEIEVLAVDCDPLATLLARSALAVVGAHNARVLQEDYTALEHSSGGGRTAYVGNPPYVRHHRLSSGAKRWASRTAARLGLSASGLAGLHAHFYLATAALAKPGDVGCFVTSAEWLDVNYGSLVRELLAGTLGGQSLHVLDTGSGPGIFADAMTTAAIACFEVGKASPRMSFRRVYDVARLGELGSARAAAVDRQRAARAARWSPLLELSENPPKRRDTVPLRDVARVHRGVATGANGFFVLTREQAEALGVARWCRPAITGARQILDADGAVRDAPDLRVLLAIPADIDRAAHPALDAYLRSGEEPANGDRAVAERYLPRHRRPWWWLGALEAPPIVASYMARQPPRFALNPDRLAILNIAHGVYPNAPLAEDQLTALVRALNGLRRSYVGGGRTYAGGLEKFEPREMEQLAIPAHGAWL